MCTTKVPFAFSFKSSFFISFPLFFNVFFSFCAWYFILFYLIILFSFIQRETVHRVIDSTTFERSCNWPEKRFVSLLFYYYYYFFLSFFFLVRFSRINRIRSIFNGMKNSIRYGTITAELTMDNNNYSCRNEQKRKNLILTIRI